MVYAPSLGPARAVFGTHSIVWMVRLGVLSFISKETEYALAGGPFFGKGTSQENFHRVHDPGSNFGGFFNICRYIFDILLRFLLLIGIITCSNACSTLVTRSFNATVLQRYTGFHGINYT